jgi:dTDP-4-dehydrorhamnose 3,5-epimerase
MSHLKFVPHGLPGMVLIEPFKAGDSRGFFMETFQKWSLNGRVCQWICPGQPLGEPRGDFERIALPIKHPQGKLVRVVIGEVFDVVVTCENIHPHWAMVWNRLSAQSPWYCGFLPVLPTDFYVVSDWAEFVYKTTDYYAPNGKEPFCGTIPRWQLTGTSRMGFPRFISKRCCRICLHEADVYQRNLEQP